MQEILSCGRSIEEYCSAFASVEKVPPDRCKECGCTKFHKWGTYERYVMEEESHRIPIQRYRCVKCRKTHSQLPSFCLKGMVYSADFVMKLLSALILKIGTVSEALKRQAYIFLRRFVQSESLWLVFLRARGFTDFPRGGKERRAKIFSELLKRYSSKSFAADFSRETGRHFMAAK